MASFLALFFASFIQQIQVEIYHSSIVRVCSDFVASIKKNNEASVLQALHIPDRQQSGLFAVSNEEYVKLYSQWITSQVRINVIAKDLHSREIDTLLKISDINDWFSCILRGRPFLRRDSAYYIVNLRGVSVKQYFSCSKQNEWKLLLFLMSVEDNKLLFDLDTTFNVSLGLLKQKNSILKSVLDGIESKSMQQIEQEVLGQFNNGHK